MNGSALDSPISSLSPDSLYFESNEEEMPSGSLLTSMDFVGDSSTGSILPITAPLSNQLNRSNQQLYPISNSTLIGTTNEDVPTYETAMNNSPSMESLLDGTFVTVSNYFNPGSTSPRTAVSLILICIK